MEQEAVKKHNYFSATRIAFIGLFGALAGVLYLLNFPISFAFPSFLEFNFSDIPVLIGTFTLGPISGSIIVAVKILIKLAFKGTTTMFVGELSDLLTGLALAVVAGLIYKKHRTFKGALVAMAAGTVSLIAVAIIMNWLVLIPFYLQLFFGGNWDALLSTMTPLFPNITKETFFNYYLWISVLPFNLLRCLVAILITLPVYKRISKLINRFNEKLTPKHGVEGGEARVKKINIWAIVIICIILAVLIVFAVCQYNGWL